MHPHPSALFMKKYGIFDPAAATVFLFLLANLILHGGLLRWLSSALCCGEETSRSSHREADLAATPLGWAETTSLHRPNRPRRCGVYSDPTLHMR